MTRIYTRTGDTGTTGLASGERVTKNSARVEAYGAVDELNCVLGVVRTEILSLGKSVPAWAMLLHHALERVQQRLFDLGSSLATPPTKGGTKYSTHIEPNDVQALEAWMDAMEVDLAPLTQFVLPGGGRVGAYLHLGRGVCRRAERRCVTLQQTHQNAVAPQDVPFLNRLSDALFVSARYAAHHSQNLETVWKQKQPMQGFWSDSNGTTREKVEFKTSERDLP